MKDGVLTHYRVIRPLGSGGMGEVYLAEDMRLEREVALKILPAAFAQDPQRRQRFLAEAKSASALNHPNVCVVYEVGETNEGVPFIAMEYIRGRMLDGWMQRQPMTLPQVVAMGLQVADALEAAHERGIVHRDIKPSNISLSERGVVKVLDFGLAKRTLGDSLADTEAGTLLATRTGQMLGTPSYMSPEQALGREVDARTDLFSLGVVLYECLAGRLPFPGQSLGEVLDKIVHAQFPPLARFSEQVHPEMERLVRKCLEKDPERRYQTARELRVDLRNLHRDLEGGGDTALLLAKKEAEQSSRSAGRSAVEPPSTSVPEPVAFPAPDPAAIGEADVYINCAQLDDQSLEEGKPGWVGSFRRHLALRVEQLAGERVSVCAFPTPPGEVQVDPAVLERVPLAKTMVALLSPAFVKSAACRQQMEAFWSTAQRNGQLTIRDRPRLFKATRTPVPARELPSAWHDFFGRLLSFEFFSEDPLTGRVRELEEGLAGASRQQYFERVYDLAWEVYQLLRVWKPGESTAPPPPPSGQTIYLAATSSELSAERDHIRRELQELGHTVLPETELPLQAPSLTEVVRDGLRQASVAVHLLGSRYGVIPEDAAESVPAIQLRLSVEQERSQGLRRLIWIPGDLAAPESRQTTFLRQVREDSDIQGGAELIEGPLNVLTRELWRALEPAPEEEEALGTGEPGASAPRLYLICDPRDEEAVEPLEDYCFGKGWEVCLPAMDGDDLQAQELHRQNLLSCDAVLVYFGAAPRAWVDIKLRDILKAGGYGRAEPIRHQAVYVAPPIDRRKERFRSLHVKVLRGESPFAPEPLERFLGEIGLHPS